jgi:4-aminobutyrate aminotransferase/(S)-3-amino-2-methylpropionate transaminase
MSPPYDWPKTMARAIEGCAPKGLTQLVTMLCGSSANENAYKASMIAYENRRRGARGAPGKASAEELDSAIVNQGPGSSQTVILSFHGAFHGRTFGALSTTHSKAMHKLDIPAFDWPVAPFPRLQYPLAENVAANEKEDLRCLAEVDAIMTRQKNQGRDVAAVVMEPIQAEGGDNHASGAFALGLRRLCTKHGASFIVDEVQTGGGASGLMWAHEHWQLPDGEEPDFVCFSKKMQTGGYFHKPSVRPDVGYRIFNTWMGEPIKMLQLDTVLNVIKRDGLLENTQAAGVVLLEGLESAVTAYPDVLTRARGLGTLCAVDTVQGGPQRDALVTKMRQRGVWVGGCGDNSIRLRPALIFTPMHAELFLTHLNAVCAELAEVARSHHHAETIKTAAKTATKSAIKTATASATAFAQ